MAITKLLLNGTEYDIGNLINEEGPQLYQGREISEYSWADLKTKCQNADFKDLRIGDYKTITVGSETVKMQIAGIDTYYRTTNQELGHHIDFISKDCLGTVVKWNDTNVNNGTGTGNDEYPYMVSNVRKHLLETVYPTLPQDVKNVIKNKRMIMEKRYSASGALTDSTSWGWIDMGQIWLPTEYEVFGSVVCGTPRWSAGQTVQYPLFANNYLHRIKGSGNGGSRCAWWLACVGSGNSTYCCYVGLYGYASDGTAGTSRGVPVCFRIAAN